MERHPEVAVFTIDDGERYALRTDVVQRLLADSNMTEEESMLALLTYPKLVEATADDATVEDVARAEAETIGDCPPVPVAPEIMEDPELRAMAFRVPQPIADYLESLSEQRSPGGKYDE